MRNRLTADQLAQLAQQEREGHGNWSHTDFLIAALIDVVRHHDYHQLVIGGAKSARSPDPIERPGVVPGRGGRLLSSAGFEYLDRIRQQRE